MVGPISFMPKILWTCLGLDVNQRFGNGTANDIWHDKKSCSQSFVVCLQEHHQNPKRGCTCKNSNAIT